MRNETFTLENLDALMSFDEIIDVRSPSEFAEDHLPGSSNHPVLDDRQRVEVGTLYKQVSPFEARKIGAAYVAANIAAHLQRYFLDRPKNWHPLIVCWRGGQRSGAMTLIFRRIGWEAQQLDGGYKTYRRLVIEQLAELPGKLTFTVLCGATGSGKSRVLQAIASLGEQVLDLEGLACHKGSVLGALPGRPQPSQKQFESQLLSTLRGFDRQRTVYVEAESR
ncbi:MAG TPA: tRNA 2-selenouridine(34) synthase MnmH, partial [Accumulibacter sp.]|nr:tRNA 2-selenouridine(34) synthase MnmH [Accumulibacter sp.]